MSNKYSANDFIKAIPGSGGIVSTIAARVGCDWHTARKYIDEYPTVAQVYRDETEKVKDRAESVLIASINDGNTQDAKWYLSKKAKERGYGDQQTLDVSPQDVINWTPDEWRKEAAARRGEVADTLAAFSDADSDA